MGRRLVAYFSATGTTAKAANALAEASGADVFEIRNPVPYTGADINWTDRSSRFFQELRTRNFRPPIEGTVARMEDYDEVYLGFPIWAYREPRIVDTFLEQYDFDGKTIVLFATSGADGFGRTRSLVERALAKADPDAHVTVRESRVLVGWPTTEFVDGHVVPGTLDDGEVADWLASLGF